MYSQICGAGTDGALGPPAAGQAGCLHVVRGQGQTDSLLVCHEQPQRMWPEQSPPAGALTGAPQNPQDRGLWGNTPGLVLLADFSAVASDCLQHRAGIAAGSFQLMDFERQL